MVVNPFDNLRKSKVSSAGFGLNQGIWWRCEALNKFSNFQSIDNEKRIFYSTELHDRTRVNMMYQDRSHLSCLSAYLAEKAHRAFGLNLRCISIFNIMQTMHSKLRIRSTDDVEHVIFLPFAA
ncbi:unnamed protein product [Albugo candida]|uniref:Uncharacterized protein n=1 Tax=Albugo candida TaxID=65357 RepID=A0A024GIM9_9STRA|nr:unnamed protein product [Albugo candida]|eukprot:CCI46748.1 unnamed protein product [Albugo candida]